MNAVLKLVATTFIPGLELRASIPVGLLVLRESVRAVLGAAGVVGVCLVANVALGMLMFEAMELVERFLLRIGWFRRTVWPILEGKREKLRPLVEKYGVWGVAVFIGIPLPGTGAYAGAVASYLLRLDRKRFWAANLLGVLCAGAAVTLICFAIDGGFIGEDSLIRRLFLKQQ